MFRLDGKLQFITINQDYLKNLHDACSEVYYKNSNYQSKPYIGILVNSNDRNYVIPLSSAKEKHKTWKNMNKECFLIYEYADKAKMNDTDIWVEEDGEDRVKHILSVIDVKKMLPIKEGLYSIAELNDNTSDLPEVKKYKDLLNKEYTFCLKIVNEIIQKADKLYNKQMASGKIVKFCCDFKALEKVCDTYEG